MRYCPQILCHNGRIFSSWGSRCCREVSGSDRRLKITSDIPIRRNINWLTVPNTNPDSPVELLLCQRARKSRSFVGSSDWSRGLEDGRQLSVVPHAVIFIRPMKEEKERGNSITQSWLIPEVSPVSSKYRAYTAHCGCGNHTTQQQKNHLPFRFHLLASCTLCFTIFRGLPSFSRFTQKWDLVGRYSFLRRNAPSIAQKMHHLNTATR